MQAIIEEVGGVALFVARAFLHILPYLALSVPLAVALKRSGAADRIRAGLSGNPVAAVFLATVVGAVSPFCSCGVIPIISALLIGGVPLAPVMSFWLASPSMDPEIFLLSAGSIGWELAVWRLAATFVMSLGAGLAVLAMERRGWLRGDMLRPALLGKAVGHALPSFKPAVAGSSCGCGTGKAGASKLVELAIDAGKTALNISLFMLLAFTLEALISRYVPQDAIASVLGGDKPWSVPLATLIGIPMYTTNLTALGVVGGLMERGMSGGAALAFLIGGAVTTIPAMSAVYGIVKAKVFGLYLGFSIAGSFFAGFAYQAAHAALR